MITLPRWKIFSIILVCISALLFSIPNFLPSSVMKSFPAWFPQKKISLGLDLQGGSHLLLGVDLDSVRKERINALLDYVRQVLRQHHLGYLSLRSSLENEKEMVRFTLREVTKIDTLKKIIKEIDPLLEWQDNDKGEITLSYSKEAIANKNQAVINQSIEIIRRRIDETGTKEPTIQRQGEEFILVQLPGIENPEHVKQLIGKTAKLTFRLVDSSVTPTLEGETASSLPLGTEMLLTEEKESDGQAFYYGVKKAVAISGDLLVDAQPSFDENGRATVTFKLSSLGAQRFGQVTSENVGQPFAIVLDNKVISAPVIREPILGGTGMISGNFTVQQAQDLALLLRAGALPAPLNVLEERTVGPELGSDSIKMGSQATLISILLVALFMVVAYGGFGMFANIGVLFNILLLLASLSLLGATLTLPGIAGIALMVGMAVDANILIYERIREETRAGQRPAIAIDSGFKRAMATIVDSNLTTLIGAVLMYQFGTGPIRGFAVTLALGIIISMFTAITLTRVLIGSWLAWKKPKTLSI